MEFGGRDLEKRFLRSLEAALGIEIRRRRTHEIYWEKLLAVKELISAKELMPTELTEEGVFMRLCLENISASTAQIFQDVFVIHETCGKRGGFFVEFGASNGVSLSNTFLLENAFGWTGVLVEPARVWRDQLVANRRCALDNRCVTDKTGDQLIFNEAADPVYSTIDSFSDADYHANRRASGKRYNVETISLNDLLHEHRRHSSLTTYQLILKVLNLP